MFSTNSQYIFCAASDVIAATPFLMDCTGFGRPARRFSKKKKMTCHARIIYPPLCLAPRTACGAVLRGLTAKRRIRFGRSSWRASQMARPRILPYHTILEYLLARSTVSHSPSAPFTFPTSAFRTSHLLLRSHSRSLLGVYCGCEFTHEALCLGILKTNFPRRLRGWVF